MTCCCCCGCRPSSRWFLDSPRQHPDVPDDLRQARLWLAEATRIGLATGLDLLGVTAPEHM